MRRLVLLRHAKSDRPAGIGDVDRPLNPRGERAAPLVGAYLAGEGLVPDHVVVSPSLRTRQTWAAIAEALGGPEAEVSDAVYEAETSSLLSVVRAAPDRAGTLLLIGHNPGLQDLAMRLVGDGTAALRRRLSAEFPTAALAVIDFEGARWADVRPGTGRLERFVRPRDLTADEAA